MSSSKTLFSITALLALLLVSTTALWAQQAGTLRGIVLTEKGKPIAGVTVSCNAKGSTTVQTSATDDKGVFTVSHLTSGNTYQFRFTHVGYETYTIAAFEMKSGEDNSLLVRLKEARASLNDIVVVGYGSQQKKQVTGAISSVKPDNADKGGTYDALKLLQGRVSGVHIITPAGTPGIKPVVLVRGVGSISSNSSPLYVIDGTPGEFFPNINPNDVENIEVLKDASAASIYGSRASSGVIIITTKTGKAGKTHTSISAYTGSGTIYHDIKMANSAQYTQVMQAAVDNYNAQKGTSLTLYKPSTIQETDWVKSISRSSAQIRSVDVNVSGGTDKTQIYTSFGYFHQQGILKTSNYRQFTMRFKINHELSRYVKLNVNLSGSVTPRRLVEEDNTSLKVLRNAREEQPWYSPYLADGTYKVNGTYIFRHNPVMEINEEKWTRNTFEGLGAVSLDITPFKGFKYTPSISAYGTLIDERKKLTDQMAARARSAGWGALLQNRNLGIRYVFDNIFSYSNKAGQLNYTLMAGHSYEKYSADLLGIYSSNYASNAYPSSNLDIINAGPAVYADPAGNGYNAYNLESYLGRLTLDYDGRYLLNASVRRDGSSRFSKASRFGTFPSVSLGWVLSREAFWPSNQRAISFLKLRSSYGVTGSLAGIGNYAALSLVSAGSSYNNQGGFVVSQDAQNVTWEKARQFDVGVDAELLNGSISFTADYFYQKNTDLLYSRPIYATSGYTSIPANIGALQNKGWELAANAKILTGALQWNAGANISFISNKLLSLYDNKSMYIVPASGFEQIGGQMHALINGQPVSAFYMLKQTGIYQADADVPQKLFAKGVRAGDVRYDDYNNDGDITDADRQYAGKAIPDFFGGITNNLRFKNFECNVFAQFSSGSRVVASWRGINSEGTEHLGDALSNVKIENGQTVEQYYNISEAAATGYWRGPGTSNTLPRPVRKGVFSGYTYNYNAMASTRFLENGSYFRIKTVTLAYNLPAALTQKWKMENIRIYVTADNLFTFTGYSGYDPEQSFTTTPGDSNYGVDFGLQSALRTYMVGVNIKF